MSIGYTRILKADEFQFIDLQARNTVVVWKLDHLTRTLKNLITSVDELDNKLRLNYSLIKYEN